LKLRGDKRAHRRVVLDHQDRLMTAFDRRTRRHIGGVEFACPRQVELDRGAVPLLAVDLDVPAGLLDEPVHHAEPETGSLAYVLGGEEGIEHAIPDRRRNSGAVSLTAIMI